MICILAALLLAATPAPPVTVTWFDTCGGTVLSVTATTPTTLRISGRDPVVVTPDQPYTDTWGSDYGWILIDGDHIPEANRQHLWRQPAGCVAPAPEPQPDAIPAWAWWLLAAGGAVAVGMVAHAARTRTPDTEPEGTDQP